MVTLFGIDEDGLSTERIIGMGAVTVAISVYSESVWWSASDEVEDEKQFKQLFLDESGIESVEVGKIVLSFGCGDVL